MENERTVEMMGKRLELIGRNWEILNALSKKESYGGELAKELRKTPSEISLNLKYLKAGGLVESRQEKGKRLKPFCLSDLGKRVFEAVTEATRLKPVEKLEEWQIDKLLEILGDTKISESVRASYSGIFHTLSHESPMQLIEHSGVRELIERIATHASVDEINKNLNRSVPVLLSQAVHHQIWRNWVVKKLYPLLIKNVGSENEETRVWALRQVVQIGALSSDPKLMSDVRKRLLKLWFSDETDASGIFGKELREQLVLICLHGGSTTAQIIFDGARTKAADDNLHTKEKAETLLQSLKECMLPRKPPGAMTVA